MAGEKTQAQIDAQIDAGIKTNGNREITPPIHNAIEKALSNSLVNKKDGGNVVQALLGYTTNLTPSDDKHFVPKKYVDDAIISAADDYYLITGDTLEGNMNAGGFSIENVDILYGSDGIEMFDSDKFYYDEMGFKAFKIRSTSDLANSSSLIFPLQADHGGGSQAGIVFMKPSSTCGIVCGLTGEGDFTFYVDNGSGPVKAVAYVDNKNVIFYGKIVDTSEVNLAWDFDNRKGYDGSGVEIFRYVDFLRTPKDILVDSDSQGYIYKDDMDGHYYRQRLSGGTLVYDDLGTSI